jgi:hypothetical protein
MTISSQTPQISLRLENEDDNLPYFDLHKRLSSEELIKMEKKHGAHKYVVSFRLCENSSTKLSGSFDEYPSETSFDVTLTIKQFFIR